MAAETPADPRHPGTFAGLPPSLGLWLAVARPRLPEALVPEDALAPLEALARRLPAEGLAALEARLARRRGAERVDLSVRILDRAAARRLAGLVEPQTLRSFLRAWADGGPAFEQVPSLWLELDLDGTPPGPLTPSVCAKLRSPCAVEWLESTLLPQLQGEPLSEPQRRRVRACLEAVPAPASLLYAFCMLPRPGRPLRLEIYGLDPEGMIRYLERVAPHALPQVREQAPLFAGIERTHLSLDLIGGEVSPRVGIEGSYERQPQREPRWRELFGRLVAAGLCTEEKRDAALAWPGWDSFWTAPGRWPAEAVGAAGYCVRALSHVKVVCRPDREPEAKVYLLLGHHAPDPARAAAQVGPGY